VARIVYDTIQETITRPVQKTIEVINKVARTVYDTVTTLMTKTVPVIKTVYDTVKETAYRLVQKPVQVVRQVTETVWQTGTRIVEKVVPVVRQMTDYVTQQVEESYLVARVVGGVMEEMVKKVENPEITHAEKAKSLTIINALKKTGKDVTIIAGVGVTIVGGAVICAGTVVGCAPVVAVAGAVLSSTPFLVVTGTLLTSNIINNSKVVLTHKDVFGNEYSNTEWQIALSDLMTDTVLIGTAGTLKYVEAPFSKLLSGLTRKIGNIEKKVTPLFTSGTIKDIDEVIKAGNISSLSEAEQVFIKKYGVIQKGLNPTKSDTNCNNCALALDNVFAGKGTKQAESADQSDIFSFSQRNYGKLPTKVESIEELESILKKSGDGSRGIVSGFREELPNETGHTFNIVNVDGKISYPDAQNGGFRNPYRYNLFYFLQTK